LCGLGIIGRFALSPIGVARAGDFSGATLKRPGTDRPLAARSLTGRKFLPIWWTQTSSLPESFPENQPPMSKPMSTPRNAPWSDFRPTRSRSRIGIALLVLAAAGLSHSRAAVGADDSPPKPVRPNIVLINADDNCDRVSWLPLISPQMGRFVGFDAFAGEVWTVFGNKGEHRIIAQARTLERAYREAIEQAKP